MTAITIAHEKLFGQRSGEERFAIEIEIGQPYQWGGTSPTEWACDITIKPWRSKPYDIHGEGSLQALCMALDWVRAELAEFIGRGGKLTSEDGEEFKLSVYWDTSNSPGA